MACVKTIIACHLEVFLRNVFDYSVNVAKVWFGINVKSIFLINKSFVFLKERPIRCSNLFKRVVWKDFLRNV